MFVSLFWFVVRQGLFAFLSFTLTCVLLMLLEPLGLADPELTSLRAGLGLFVLLAVVTETIQLQSNLNRRTATLKRYHRSLPFKLEGCASGVLFWVGSGSLLVVAFFLRLVWTGALPSVVEFGFVLFTSVYALRLFVGGVTRFRYWIAARSIQGQVAPVGTFPIIVSLEAALAIVVISVFRLPWLGYFQIAAMVLLGLIYKEADPEVLLELHHHEPTAEVMQLLQHYNIPLEYAVPSASQREDRLTHNTIVARVPAYDLLSFLYELDTLQEHINTVDYNSPILATSFDRSESAGGPCKRRPNLTYPNDPFSGAQDALFSENTRRILGTYRVPRGPTKLAIIDTGVDWGHEELRDLVIHGGSPRDSHGTSVAGVAAGRTHNGRGIASTNEGGRFIEILDIPAITERNPSADDIAQALHRAADLGATVVVMAFEGNDYAPEVLKRAVEHAHRKDMIIVAAAGNGGRTALQWPASLEGVLVVAGLNGRRRASFSNRPITSSITVGAPAVNICAPVAGGGYRLNTGTSMSAAIVGGAIARRRAQCPFETRETILINLLTSSPANLYGEHPVNLGDFLIKRCE